MQKLKSSLMVLATAGFLALVGTHMTREANAQNQNNQGDTVTIGAPLPLPVSLTGSGSVNVAGTPNVNVVNSAGAPVQVHDVNDADQPVSANGFAVFNGIMLASKTLFTVPAGKRLVIEYFSAICDLPAGSTVMADILFQGGGNVFFTQYLPMSLPAAAIAPNAPTENASVGGLLRVYAEPGTQVFAEFRSNVANAGNCFSTITGHLVNAM